MALQPRVLHRAAGRGIDQTTRHELLDMAAANLRAENVRQDSKGAYTKRRGFSALSLTRLDATSRSVGHRLFSYGNQPCVADGHYLDVYSHAGAFNITRDRVPEPMPLRVPVPNQGKTPGLSGAIYVNGYIVIGTRNLSTVLVSVLDATTYAVIRQDSFTGSATAVFKLGVVGSVAFLVYTAAAANTLACRTLDTTSRATLNTGWSAATNIATDYGTSLTAVAACSLEDRFCVAYENNSGGASRLTVKTISTALATLETLTVNTSSTTPGACDVAGSNADTLWIAWSEGTAIKALGTTGNSLATTKATTATVTSIASGAVAGIGIAVTGTGAARLYGQSLSSSTSFQMIVRSWTTSAGAVTPGAAAISYYWAATLMNPFVVDGRIYVGVVQIFGGSNDNDDRIFCLVDMTEDSATLRPVCNIGPGTSLGSGGQVARLSSTKIALLNGFQTSGTTTYVDGAGIELVVLDFESRARWMPHNVATSVALTGGVASVFDGNQVVEIGFLLRPNKPTETHAAGSTLTATVGYRYIAIYEHTDANGNVHVSGTSDPSASTGVFAGKDVIVTVNNLFVTSRYDLANATNPVRIGLYRTTDGGTTFYRVTTLTNSTSAATQTYTDTMTDADLATKAKLYRQPLQIGTSLDRRPPPGARGMTVCNDVLVVLADDGLSLWPAGQPVYGEGAWFSPAVQQPVTDGGVAAAINSMDGVVYLFKRRSIYGVPCEVMSDNGAAGGLGQARRLACDVGAISPHTALTSKGIIFQSERGIELLSRAQTVEYVGEPVQPELDARPIVTAMTVDSANALVYIELAASESAGLATGTGRTLVFDLTLGQWVSVDRRKNSAGTADTPAQSAAIVYDGSAYRYAWLGTDGRVYVEQAASYLDSGAWVTSLWETPRVRIGLLQQQMVWEAQMLLEQESAAGLQVEIAYGAADYAGGAAGLKTWTEAQALGQTRFPLMPTPENFAIGFRVSDTAPATLGTGQGFTFVGISMDQAAKQGSTKGTPHSGASMVR